MIRAYPKTQLYRLMALRLMRPGAQENAAATDKESAERRVGLISHCETPYHMMKSLARHTTDVKGQSLHHQVASVYA